MFQLESERDISMFEAIKDQKEMLEFRMDKRRMTAMERLGFVAHDERMQMLADIARKLPNQSFLNRSLEP